MMTVVVTGALRPFEALPSFTCHVTVRERFVPPWVGSAPELIVTPSKTR
jgi:hypothetical protein